jgi:DNA-binding NarL/FixJ family response regulator
MSVLRLNGEDTRGENQNPPIALTALRVGDILVNSSGVTYRVTGKETRPTNGDEFTLSVRLEPADLLVSPVLTSRQNEVARLMASRATITEIAALLQISTHTARHHSQAVMKKLGLRRRCDVRTWSIEHSVRRAGEQDGLRGDAKIGQNCPCEGS